MLNNKFQISVQIQLSATWPIVPFLVKCPGQWLVFLYQQSFVSIETLSSMHCHCHSFANKCRLLVFPSLHYPQNCPHASG